MISDHFEDTADDSVGTPGDSPPTTALQSPWQFPEAEAGAWLYSLKEQPQVQGLAGF